MRDRAIMAGGRFTPISGARTAFPRPAETPPPVDSAEAGDRLAALRREIAVIEGKPLLGMAPEPSIPEATEVPTAPPRGELPAGVAMLRAPADAAKPDVAVPKPATPPAWGSRRRRGGVLPLGLPELDATLGGGLLRAALHEIRAETTREAGAQTGFAVALLARLAASDARPVLWVEEETALTEGGHPYGPGLAAFGLDPGRLILVTARKPDEALWALEEGLRCAGLAAAVGVLRGHPRALDLTGHRRLALRARAHGVTGLLLRQAGEAEPGAALTRWRVSARPAGIIDGYAAGVGRPAFRLEVEKNRLGPTGSFDVEWDHESRRFAPLAGESHVHGPGASDAGALAPLSFHRPAAPDRPRPGLAVRAAG